MCVPPGNGKCDLAGDSGACEGCRLDAGVQLRREGLNGVAPFDAFGPWLTATWSHNLSLNHQLSLEFNSAYLWADRQSNDSSPRSHQGLVTVS